MDLGNKVHTIHRPRPAVKQDQARLSDLRFRLLCAKVHACGPRVLAELLAELGRERMIQTEVEQKLERYAQLDPARVRAVGADRFPPLPLRLVQRGNLP
jgi:hypothetical protein